MENTAMQNTLNELMDAMEVGIIVTRTVGGRMQTLLILLLCVLDGGCSPHVCVVQEAWPS